MKQLLVFQGPVSSRSGYGDHSRDLVKSLIKMDRFNIKINDMPWGVCPRDGLKKGLHDEIISMIVNGSQLERQPEVFIQVSVPNEFYTLGKFNIGITAGIETTLCAPEWIEGLNRMDLIIVPSNHAKNVFLNTVYDKKDKATKQTISQLKVEKPIEVLFEGVDLEVFNTKNEIPKSINKAMDNIDTKYNFLVCAHWLNGEYGHDRKDLATTLRCFLETFKKTKKKPGLVLKTSSATFSIKDRVNMLARIETVKESSGLSDSELSNIYLLHGDLSEKEMNGLYNHHKIKSMVSFTKGEGYGRPLAEFSTTGKPIIASNWSGHLDFCKYIVKVGGDLKNVHESALWDKVILPESKWFYVNVAHGSRCLLEVFNRNKQAIENAKKQKTHINKNFSLEAMDMAFAELINTNIPVQEQIKLPKLKLPKLNKV